MEKKSRNCGVYRSISKYEASEKVWVQEMVVKVRPVGIKSARRREVVA